MAEARDRAELRSLLGISTAVWAGMDGVEVEADRWAALSGAAAGNTTSANVQV